MNKSKLREYEASYRYLEKSKQKKKFHYNQLLLLVLSLLVVYFTLSK